MIVTATSNSCAHGGSSLRNAIHRTARLSLGKNVPTVLTMINITDEDKPIQLFTKKMEGWAQTHNPHVTEQIALAA